MAKYRVYGTATVSVYVEIDATSPEEAINLAYNECDGLTSFAGNGGMDKMVGVYGSNVSIEAEGEVDYTEAELIEDE